MPFIYVLQGGSAGITRERVIVLFFFCSDVALEALRRRLDGAVARLTRWALDFIREHVSTHSRQNFSFALSDSFVLSEN